MYFSASAFKEHTDAGKQEKKSTGSALTKTSLCPIHKPHVHQQQMLKLQEVGASDIIINLTSRRS